MVKAKAYLTELREYRAWEKVPVDKPYGTEDRMLLAELGKRAEEIAAQLRALKLQEAEARGKLAEPGEIGNGRSAARAFST